MHGTRDQMDEIIPVGWTGELELTKFELADTKGIELYPREISMQME